MATREIERLRKLLPELCIQRALVPGKIIIYGSYATGKATTHSDMDIILVSKSFRGKGIYKRVALTRGIHRELVKKLRRPIDMMYYSDSEWDKEASLTVREAKQTGKVIFTS